jgi:hypothetical protein
VTNVLPGSQGAVHCEGFVEVAWVDRAAARKAARMPCRVICSGRGNRAPDCGCQYFFPFYCNYCDHALWTRGPRVVVFPLREGWVVSVIVNCLAHQTDLIR